MRESEIIEALASNKPFKDLRGVEVANLRIQPSIVPATEREPGMPGTRRVAARPDVRFDLKFAANSVTVYGEVKSVCTPKLVQQIAPWLASLKARSGDSAYALICPSMSLESQQICDENNVDFIDLGGNLSINIPGKFLLRRIGVKKKLPGERPSHPDPFSPAASRIVRVLLEKPQGWALTEIATELLDESKRLSMEKGGFAVSVGTISKTLKALEEELLVLRRGSKVLVAEPSRLLTRWAEKYKERYRGYLRRSKLVGNPFGSNLQLIGKGLAAALSSRFAFTGVAATMVTAPFVDLDTVDLYVVPQPVPGGQGTAAWRTTIDAVYRGTTQMGPDRVTGPALRFISPYDIGVLMYSREEEGIPVVSPIQTYLDLYAKGGRDLKQAEYLLEKVIKPRWQTA